MSAEMTDAALTAYANAVHERLEASLREKSSSEAELRKAEKWLEAARTAADVEEFRGMVAEREAVFRSYFETYDALLEQYTDARAELDEFRRQSDQSSSIERSQGATESRVRNVPHRQLFAFLASVFRGQARDEWMDICAHIARDMRELLDQGYGRWHVRSIAQFASIASLCHFGLARLWPRLIELVKAIRGGATLNAHGDGDDAECRD